MTSSCTNTMASPSLKATLQRVVTAAVCGFLCAVLSLVAATADAALLFQGSLSSSLAIAVSMTVMGTVIIAIAMSVSGQIEGAISGSQEAAIVILAAVLSNIEQQMRHTYPNEELVATAVATLVSATLLFGVVTWISGHFRLGRFLRYIPYPVLTGFLAGAAILLILFSISVLLGEKIEHSGFAKVDPTIPEFIKVGLGVLLVLLLLAMTYKGLSMLWVPVLLLAMIGLFHFVVMMSNLQLHALIADNWTLSNTAISVEYPPIKFDQIELVQWSFVLQQAPQLTILIVVLLSTLLIKIGALEHICKADVDQDKELKITGLANIFCGIAATVPGFHTIILSIVQKRMAVKNRLPGIFMGIFCLLGLVILGEVLTYLPRFVFGGMLLWVGADLLMESLVKPYRLLNRWEMGSVILICIVVVGWGLMQGLIIGLAVGLVLFVIDYSRISIIGQQHTGTNVRSSVDRNESDHQLLNEHGRELLVYRLQGYVFFGTAHQFVQQIKKDLERVSDLQHRHVLLDLTHITGYDLAAFQTYLKLEQLAKANHFKLLIAGLKPGHRQQSNNIDLAALEKQTGTKYLRTLDFALEWWEEQVLSRANTGNVRACGQGLAHFFSTSMASANSGPIVDYLEETYLPAKEVLVKQGAEVDSVYFVESGTLDVLVATESTDPIRVRKVSAGACLGEISLYLGERASATIVSNEDCRLWRLTRKKLELMLNNNPSLSSAFHQSMAAALAYRLTKSNSLISKSVLS